MTVTGQDRGKVQISQINAALDYCKYYNGVGDAFTTLDTYVDKLPIVTAENQNMLVNTSDYLYIGKSNAFYGFGLCLNTFGDYGALTWQYYNDEFYSYAVTGGTQAGGAGVNYFDVAENITTTLAAGEFFKISGSTGNDGAYEAVSVTWTGILTRIVVVEAIPDSTFDGTLYVGDWKTFTPLYDSTEGFEAHGVVVWGVLEDWAAFTVDSQEAFWVRVSAASVTTAAKFYNLLRNITISEPFKLETRTLDGGLHDDIQGDIQKTDITDYNQRGFLTLSDLDVMSISQEGLHQLKKWERDRNQLWITDLARTDPVDFSVDAFIRNYVGYLTSVNGAIESPYKESFPHSLQFKFEDIVTGSDAIGSETFEDQGGELGFDWTRDSATADSTSDGGDNFHIG